MSELACNNFPLPPRNRVIETIMGIFVREIGLIDRSEVNPSTNIDSDLYIDSDDISLFLLAVEKHFNICPAPEEWLTVHPTIEGIAEFVLCRLSTDRPALD